MQRERPQIDLEDYIAKLAEREQTADGREIPDPVPIEPPVGFIRQPSMIDNIRALVQGEHLRREALAAGAETFEEADDFDIDDDPVDYTSPYEEFFDPAPGAPKGPPGEVHPARQDPNAPPAATTPPPDPKTEPTASENQS